MIRFIISIILMLIFSSLAVERPNILVLISDDQNMDSIGAYGARFKTPHIDRLASEGIMHTRAYTTSSLCVPTRYSCLTGSYPSRSRNRYFKGYNYQPAIRNGAFFCKHDRTIVEALQSLDITPALAASGIMIIMIYCPYMRYIRTLIQMIHL